MIATPPAAFFAPPVCRLVGGDAVAPALDHSAYRFVIVCRARADQLDAGNIAARSLGRLLAMSSHSPGVTYRLTARRTVVISGSMPPSISQRVEYGA